jgi:hypothetical protein
VVGDFVRPDLESARTLWSTKVGFRVVRGSDLDKFSRSPTLSSTAEYLPSVLGSSGPLGCRTSPMFFFS